jgi:pimeloyl-ACP methyl ester carboxylesterase
MVTSHTNVFAPMYRQWNLLYGTGGSMGGAPYDDIVEAFEYYYTTVNKGERPFIIYGFSQGGYLAIELASRYLGSASRIHYNDNHIITYAVGYAPTQTNINRNSRLRFSQSYNDIGVIVSWNSIAPSELSRVESANLIAPYSTLSRNGLVTNPITWTTDNRASPASQNKRSLTGTLTPNLQSNYVGAQALTVGGGNFGILLILDLEAAGASPSSTMLGKYHTQDEDFFYESIMDNIKDRIDAFKAANGGTTSVRETSREIPGGIY